MFGALRYIILSSGSILMYLNYVTVMLIMVDLEKSSLSESSGGGGTSILNEFVESVHTTTTATNIVGSSSGGRKRKREDISATSTSLGT